MSRVQLTQALRDFFASVQARDMQAAVSAVAAQTCPAPEVGDWEEVEFGFNRLFVGPMALQAPPYASVYLESDPRLMGPSTLQVRRAYRNLGLASPQENSLPDDHLALELDACAVMQARLSAGDLQLTEVWTAFVQGHMARWIPGFIARLLAAPELHPIFVYMAARLEDWLEGELALLTHGAGETVNHNGGWYEQGA